MTYLDMCSLLSLGCLETGVTSETTQTGPIRFLTRPGAPAETVDVALTSDAREPGPAPRMEPKDRAGRDLRELGVETLPRGVRCPEGPVLKRRRPRAHPWTWDTGRSSACPSLCQLMSQPKRFLFLFFSSPPPKSQSHTLGFYTPRAGKPLLGNTGGLKMEVLRFCRPVEALDLLFMVAFGRVPSK